MFPMAANNQDQDSENRWKSRYYEALGEIEEREKTWREAELLLHQLVTKLSLVADKRHQGLTQNLSELRNAVREGRDILRLRELIDKISAQVVELDTMRSEGLEPLQPARLLLDVLDKLQLQDANARDLRQLKKQLAELNPGDDVTAVRDRFAGMLNALIEEGDDLIPARSRKQKLLDRILMRQEKVRLSLAKETSATVELQVDSVAVNNEAAPKVSQKLMAPAVGDLLLQLALRLPNAVKRQINFQVLKKHTNRARQRKDLIAIIDVIAQNIDAAYTVEDAPVIILDDDSIAALARAVYQLLAQMNPPQDLRERISELEKFYDEQIGDIEGLIHCLNSLSQVVAEICQRLSHQHEDLEGYFVQLGMRLQDLDIGLQKTARLYSELHLENQHMDRAVQGELRGIQEAIQGAGDHEQLKIAIQQRLEIIDKHLQHYFDAEKKQNEQAQQIIGKLCDQVSTLESESGQLRNRLESTDKQAMRDALTGIPNRQAYEERLATEIARCKRYGTALSMVVWGVDNFKAINENYGRAGGDRILKIVAETLTSRVRETDFVAYYDGEEFVMLMPETLLVSALQVAEKLHNEIEQITFNFHETRVAVTLSAGIAQYNRDELVTSLFERADAALFDAREAGGNRLYCATPAPGNTEAAGQA